jgi:hypothetical protein
MDHVDLTRRDLPSAELAEEAKHNVLNIETCCGNSDPIEKPNLQCAFHQIVKRGPSAAQKWCAPALLLAEFEFMQETILATHVLLSIMLTWYKPSRRQATDVTLK